MFCDSLIFVDVVLMHLFHKTCIKLTRSSAHLEQQFIKTAHLYQRIECLEGINLSPTSTEYMRR